MENRNKLLFGSFFLIILLVLISPFADPNPDGLESAAGDGNEEGSTFDLGFLTDYGSEESLIYQLIQNEFLATIISGLIGIILVASLFALPIVILRSKKSST